MTTVGSVGTPGAAASASAAVDRLVLAAPEAAPEAARDAAGAADLAEVDIVAAEDERASRLVALAGDAIWGPHGTMAPNELRALAYAGNPVHLALDRRDPGRPVVGFALGFLGWSPALHVHSHQAGVVPGHRRRGIGYALKLAQRHTCLEHGIGEMRWTFDPLVRRNTAFNLTALGARAAGFHPDFYGTMDDAINAGESSDRLEAVWDLARPLPTRDAAAVCGSGRPGAPVLLRASADGPVVTGLPPSAGAQVDVPADHEAMRSGDPARARAWRAAVREVLGRAYGSGFRIVAVGPDGYVLGDAEQP